MEIHGFLKTTLLDYPGKVASTVFCGSCNFRCPFCHNSDLVLCPETVPVIPEEEIFTHFRKRKNILGGVCVTGGEPTLQPDLEAFLRRIKELDFQVKLDTNGYRPELLQHLCEAGLVDYVAMDIKHAPQKYNLVCNVGDFHLEQIQKSIDYLMQGTIPYEFRTTTVRELHAPEDFTEIGKWLQGASAYYIQSYKDSDQVLCSGYSSYSREELTDILSRVTPYLPNAQLRGVD